MSPIGDGRDHELVRRLIFWGDYGGDGSSNWYDWGRWVLLGIIVGVALLFLLALQFTSCRRVRRGQRPIPGTTWMVPPSYHASQQQYHNDYSLPTYKPEPGEGDAGYYENGQFIPYVPPAPANHYANYGPPSPTHSASQHPSHTAAATANTPEEYQPPSVPPPSHQSGFQPPAGPPPGREDYYRPPAGPPPGHSGAQGSNVDQPQPAKFKN